MKACVFACAAGLALLSALPPGALAADRTETVKFAPGTSATTLKGKIKGYDGVNYRLGARKGQVMQVLFSPSNGSCYMNVFVPGEESARFIGSTSGNEFGLNLEKSGTYTVQVYLMRNAARRAESCSYTLSFEITG